MQPAGSRSEQHQLAAHRIAGAFCKRRRGAVAQSFRRLGPRCIHSGGKFRILLSQAINMTEMDRRTLRRQFDIAGFGKCTQKRSPPARRTGNAGSHKDCLWMLGDIGHSTAMFLLCTEIALRCQAY